MEWLRLLLATLAMVVVLVVPGYVVARTQFISRTTIIGVSPCLSVALYVMLGIFLGAFGFRMNALALPVLALVIALVFALFLRLIGKRVFLDVISHERIFMDDEAKTLVAYIVVGLVLAFFYFLMSLDGAGSFANASDSCAHLNFVRAFVESGTYSTLRVTSDASLITEGSFYPAAWHVLVAIATSFTNGSITMAANSVNFLILSFVYPSACALLMGVIFPDGSVEKLAGSLASVCFVGFPWIFLVWGQLVSNLLGFALVPVFVFLFRELLFSEDARSTGSALVPFLLATVALVFSQPNSVFTAGIFCLPFIVKRARLFLDFREGGTSNGSLASAVVLLLVALVWVALYKAPFMKGVVSVNWHPSNSIFQALINAFSLAYGSLQTAQPLLALFVVLGYFRMLADKDRRSLCAVYLFCLLIHIENSTVGFPHARVLAGFWYNDPYRTGAMLALSSIPLASAGMSFCASRASRILVGPCDRCALIHLRVALTAVLAIALLIPTYELPGYGTRRTGFGALSESMSTLYRHDNSEGIDNEEWAFLDKVQAIAGDEPVFNIPEDGSGVLYGVSGMNVLFRRFPAEACDQELVALGKNLSEIATDSVVRRKVRSLGVRYVMMLDCNASEGEGSIVPYANQLDTWRGVYSINDSTPGFTLILSEGDMRLYKIDDEFFG